MGKQIINLCPVPTEEKCVQISDKTDYLSMMTKEVQVFKDMLERYAKRNVYGKQGNAFFKIETYPHDFGSYKEVVICYEDTSEIEINFVSEVESNLSRFWDAEAKKQLGPEYFEYINNKNIGDD